MVRSATAAGVRGSRSKVAVVEVATGRVSWEDEKRQGVTPVILLGDIVSVIAYDRRR